MLNFSRPPITNLRMDPFERQFGDLNRQLNEHKTWALTPIIGVVQAHLQSFVDYPVRQQGLSGNVGKTIEAAQQQLLKLQSSN
jgi:hypothetical protein